MKKLFSLIAMAGALVLAPDLHASFGGDVVLSGGGANGGGPFTAVSSGNGTFTTFCLSIGTFFQTGVHYQYEASPTILANVPIPGHDYVTLETSYIYHEYLAGNPEFANGNDVQSAIWYSQGLLVDASDHYGLNGASGGFFDGENPSSLVDLSSGVNAILQNVPAQYQSSGPARFGIEAMNMIPGYGGAQYAQPQLIAVPEPTTMVAGALLLLPFGASTLRILRKRQVS